MTTSHQQTSGGLPADKARRVPQETEPGSARSALDFRSVLQTLPSAAYLTDAEGLITDFNRRAVELWGREPKRNDILDRY